MGHMSYVDKETADLCERVWSEFRVLAHFGTCAIGPVPMPTPHTLCHPFSGGASLTHWSYFFFFWLVFLVTITFTVELIIF